MQTGTTQLSEGDGTRLFELLLLSLSGKGKGTHSFGSRRGKSNIPSLWLSAENAKMAGGKKNGDTFAKLVRPVLLQRERFQSREERKS